MQRRSLSILYLIENCGHGGAEAQIAMQAARAAELGHRVLVAVPGSDWLTEELGRRGVAVHELPAYRGKLPSLRWARPVRELARANQVDIIQAYLLQMNLCAAVAGRMVGVPAVASVRGRSYDFDRRWRLWAYGLAARAGVTFTTPSLALREDLIRESRVPAHRVVAIHNGVDLDRLQRAIARPSGDALPRGFRIGAVGRLDPVKGLEHFLAAAALIAPQAPDARFILVGDGPSRAALEWQVRELGLGERVTFLGQREDAPSLLASLDVFVLPSLSEGLSNSLLEAMAAARPIVATDIGPNAEVVSHGQDALLVPPGDPRSLAKALLDLYRDPELAANLARSAQSRLETEFSLAHSSDQYLALYYALVEGREVASARELACRDARTAERP